MYTVQDEDTVQDLAPNLSSALPEQNESAIQITLKDFKKEQVSLKSYITEMGLQFSL